MSPARRRFSSIIFFTATILLATAICSALYFFKIQKNEDYQNQLHFRELNEIALSISNGIEQLSRVADVSADPLLTSVELLQKLARRELNQRQSQASQMALDRLNLARDALINEVNHSLYYNIDSTSPLSDLRKRQEQLIDEQLTLYEQMDIEEEQLYASEEKVSEILYQYLQSAFSQLSGVSNDLAIAYCKANEVQAYCRYVTNISEALTRDIIWIENVYQGELPISADITARWQQQYQDLRAEIVAEQGTLSRLAELVANTNTAEIHKQLQTSLTRSNQLRALYLSLSKACVGSQLSLCVQLAKNDNQQYTRATKSVQSLTEQLQIWLSSFPTELDHQSKLLKQKLTLLDGYAVRWQALVAAMNSAEVSNPTLAEISRLMQQMMSGAAQFQKDEWRIAEIDRELSEIELALAQYRQQQDQDPEALRAKELKLLDLDNQIRRIEKGLLQDRRLWGAALQSAKESIKLLSGKFSLLAQLDAEQDNFYVKAMKLANLLPNKLSYIDQRSLAILSEIKRDYLGPLAKGDLRQRVQLASGGDALRNLALDYNENDNRTEGDATEHQLRLSITGQAITAAYGANKFTAPLADFIPSKLLMFPLVLVSDEQGHIVARKEVLANAVDTADLEFENVQGFFSRLARAQQSQVPDSSNSKDADDGPLIAKTRLPHYSGMLDQEIGGVRYKVYIQPVTSNNELANLNQLYLVGIVPIEKLRFDKLRVSPATAMWFVLGLICLLAVIPLIKLRFVSVRYTFSRADISQVTIGLIILLGVLSIGISDQFFFAYYKHSKIAQAKGIYTGIQSDFTAELEAIRAQREQLFSAQGGVQQAALNTDNGRLAQGCVQRLAPANVIRRQFGTDYVEMTNCPYSGFLFSAMDKQEDRLDYIVEGSFWLDHNGSFASASAYDSGRQLDSLMPMHWLNSQLFIANDIQLDHRDYFKNAITCSLWGSTPFSCKSGFTIQRINNVRDGRKSSQFAFAEYDSIFKTQMSERLVSSLGIRLRSFFARVMPMDFGYLVFSPDGEVLYHSDDSRSLLENIYVETNDNKQLRTIVSHQEGQQAPLNFETLYRNSEHLFVAGQLHPDMPWYLVVYHSQTPVLIGNMLLVFISICLFLGLLTPLFLWARYGTEQNLWRRLLMYNPAYRRVYGQFAWWLGAASLLCILTMGVFHELIVRLVFWLAISALLLLLMLHKLCAEQRKRLRLIHPLSPLLFTLVLLALLAVYNVHRFTWGTSTNDLVAMGAGLVLALTMVVIGRRQTSANQQYQRLDSRRYSNGYCWYLVTACWLASAIPAMLIVNSANKYLLHHQAHIHSEHLQQAQASYTEQVDRYLDLMSVGPQQYRYQDWLTEASLKQMYPASNSQSYRFPWVELNPADTEQQDHLPADSADLIIEALVKQSDIGGSIDADLHYLAKQQGRNEQYDLDRVNYDADKFLLSAAIWQGWLILFMLAALLLFSYKLIRFAIVQRLLGEQLPDNFRQFDIYKQKEKVAWFTTRFQQASKVRVQLIRSSSVKLKYLIEHIIKGQLYQRQVINIEDCLAQEAGGIGLCSELQRMLNTEEAGHCVLALSGLDDLAFDKQKRQLALTLLQKLSAIDGLHIVLVCEVAPLFRLVKQDAYPDIDVDELADADEILAWSKLLSPYHKFYDWSPAQKQNLGVRADLFALLQYETESWPELAPIRKEFEQYHLQVKCKELAPQLDADSLSRHWTQDQIVEFYASHAGAIYREKWQQCTKDEKLLLYQLANGAMVNPANIEVLEHLVRRGYLYRDAGWHLTSFSFRRFVLSAESEEKMADWLTDANQGLWQFIRLPIMVAALVLVVLILLGTGEGIESILAILSALLGLIPLMLRNFAHLSGQQTISSD